MEGTVRNLINTATAVTMIALFAVMFWVPVVGAVVARTETYTVTSTLHLPIQELEAVY
jgi:hypothetical protein